jgi:hypothetical protein
MFLRAKRHIGKDPDGHDWCHGNRNEADLLAQRQPIAAQLFRPDGKAERNRPDGTTGHIHLAEKAEQILAWFARRDLQTVPV